MKIGRNDPCPCGSGKKFKKCCLLKDQTESFTRNLSIRTHEKVLPKLMDYVQEKFEAGTMQLAREEFFGEHDEIENQEAYQDLFIHWFLFMWIPADLDLADGIYPSPHTIAAQFLKERRKTTDSTQVRYIEAACKEPLSFWQIEDILPGRELHLKDVLAGREKIVNDKKCSETAQKWDIIFGSTMELNGVTVFRNAGPFLIPAVHKRHIIEEFGRDVQNCPESEQLTELFDLDVDFIWFYLALMDHLFHPAMPEISNIDGSALILTNSFYKFDPMNRNSIIENLQSTPQFDRDPDSTKQREIFIWCEELEQPTPGMECVLKGRLEVRRSILETETNSAERDIALRNKLKKALDRLITHHKTASKPLSRLKPPTEADAAAPINPEDLSEEDRNALQAQMDEIYLQWADTEVPALDGLTPREALKTPSYKEHVIDLINGWENLSLKGESRGFVFDFNKLRRTLGLPEE